MNIHAKFCLNLYFVYLLHILLLNLITILSKEITKGKLQGDVKDLVVRVFREFYNFMWTQRGYWEPRLKNA